MTNRSKALGGVFLALGVLLLEPTTALAQVCSVVGNSTPSRPCEPTEDNPNPCPTGDIALDVSCRYEDCMMTVTAIPASRQPMIEKIEWTLSDGFHLFQRGQTLRLRHLFPTGGTAGATYTVTVKPTFKDTGPGTATSRQIVIEGEVPYFGYNTNFWGLTAEFGTTFGNAADWRYEWDYGDGTIGQNKSWMETCKTYAQPGRYLVKLHMWRSDHCPPTGCNEEYSVQQLVDVPNRPPDAQFSVSQNVRAISVDAGATTDEPNVEEVWLRSLSTNCGARRTNSTVDFQWDWGDGAFNTGSNATHTYSTGGSYRVKLQAKDRSGSVQVSEKVVGIPVDPPRPAFSFSCSGRTCEFDAGASSAPDVSSYNWTFGTTPASSGSPRTSFTFPADGYYVVALTTNTGGSISPPVRRELRVTSRPTSELLFVSSGPCRLIDTRENGGAAIASGQTLNIAAVPCVPNSPDIVALAVNLTTVAGGSAGPGKGVLYAFRPGFGDANRVIAQSFNKAISGNRANSTIVQLGTSGTFSIVPNIPQNGSTHIVADVTGYFVRSGSTLAGMVRGLKFNTLPFCTAFDSVSAGGQISVGLPAFNRIRLVCGVPLTAEAASIHLTAVRPTIGAHFSVIPSTLSSTITSAINVWPNVILANAWLGALGRQTAHDLRLSLNGVAGGTSHYKLAVNGYFEPAASLVYYPIDPCRAVDTTRATQTGYARPVADAAQSYQVQGNCGVPSGAVAAAVNVTAVNPAGAGELTLFPSDAGLYPADPLTSSVFQNFIAGDDITTSAIVPLSPHELDFGLKTRGSSADIFVDVVGYFAPPGLSAAELGSQEENR